MVRRARQGDESMFDVGLGVPMVLLVVLLAIEAWRGHGVRLHPHGVRQIGPLSSLTVPWAALPTPRIPPDADRPAWLPMAYAQPQLVRWRGIPWSRRRCTRTASTRDFSPR